MAVTSRTRRTAAKKAQVLSGKFVVPMGDYDPEADQSYAGEQPRPGNYTFRLVEVRAHTAESSGNESIYWRFRIDDPKSPFDGWPYGEMYTNLEGAKFKTQQIVYALTGGTKDLALDLSDSAAGEKARKKLIADAPLVRGSIRLEPSQSGDEMRAKLGRVMPMPATAPGDDEDDDFEDADEYVDEEEVDEEEEYEEDEEDSDEDEEDEDEEDEDEDEQEDDDEEEEEDPEPEPAPRRRAAAKKAAPAKRAAPATRAAKKAAPARRARR